MKTQKIADRLILWTLCGALIVIAAQVSWLRELFLIWLLVGVPFALIPLFGCTVGPKLQKLQRQRKVRASLTPVRVVIPSSEPFPQQSFHRKDFTVN
jgi:hypothetical protein